MAEAPSPWSSSLSTFQVIWDSTSLGWLKTCPAYYRYQMIEGWRLRSVGIHLMFGSLYAKGVETYAKLKAEGLDHNTATREMVRAVLCAAGERDEEGVWHPWNPPADHKDANIKNRYTLIRSLVWNVEDRQDSPFQVCTLSDGKAAVELSFEFPAFEVGDEQVSLAGHMDSIVENIYTKERYVSDDKAQPVWCEVLGREGWRMIGTLCVGDEIAGRDGKFYKVTALHPKGVVSVYRVTFEDSSQTYTADDHLWQVADANNRGSTIKSTEQLRLGFERGSTTRWHIPHCQPIEHSPQKLPVDPYLLGVLLGDGYLAGNSVAFSTANDALVEKVKLAVERMGDTVRKSPSDNLVWTITNHRHCATLEGLKSLGLKGCLARTKFIPKEYLIGSIDQRRAILEGLLDTDGSWATPRQRRYQSMSAHLAEGVAALVRSLGGWAKVSLQTRNMYRVVIRMGERDIPIRPRYIRDIEYVGEEESVCIEVDSPDHLYLTENYIVTHNTTKSALNMQYFRGYSPHNQMSLYSIAGRVILEKPVAGVLVRAAQILVEGTRFVTQQVIRPPQVLEEWLDDTEYWINRAHGFAISNKWPRNDTACDRFGGCPFQQVCSRVPTHRRSWLQEDFIKQYWNPVENRGDA